MRKFYSRSMAILLTVLLLLSNNIMAVADESDAVDISDTATVSIVSNALIYNGKEQFPEIEVKYNGKTLVKNTDYDIVYPESSVNAGTYTATVNYIGSYAGQSEFDYKIRTANGSFCEMSMDLSSGEYTYDGTAKTPKITFICDGVQLVEGKDFDAVYENNINVGNAKASTVLKGNYSGTWTVGFSINPANKCIIKLSSTSFVYNSANQKPDVTVTDKNGKVLENEKDYTLSNPYNKNVGKYTVTATMKGNYTGTISKTYSIVPETTSVRKLTPTLQGFKASWYKKTDNVSGYQVQYASDSKFTKNRKTLTIKNNATTSQAFTKMGNKKSYYVRVRTYKNVQDTKLYSSWSAAKKVTVKSVNDTKLTSLVSAKYAFTANYTKAQGVTGYQIQYSKKSDMSKPSYVRISNSKTTSKKVTGLTGGATYYVRVRTYKTVKSGGKNVNYYGSWSTKKSVKTKKYSLAAPTLKSATCPKSITYKMTWTKVSGATGYQIQILKNQSNNSNLNKKHLDDNLSCKSSNNSYYYKGTIKGANNTSYSIGNLKKNTLAGGRVRAYKKVNGRTIYSAWSDIKSTKVYYHVDKSKFLTPAQKEWVVENTIVAYFKKHHRNMKIIELKEGTKEFDYIVRRFKWNSPEFPWDCLQYTSKNYKNEVKERMDEETGILPFEFTYYKKDVISYLWIDNDEYQTSSIYYFNYEIDIL